MLILYVHTHCTHIVPMDIYSHKEMLCEKVSPDSEERGFGSDDLTVAIGTLS